MAANHQGRPDPVGSGALLPAGPPLPKFPNNVDLVQDESNTKLLQALLPALNKYKCLEVGVKKTGRSPFVRAFCDLYHPSGPWGKFSNVPDITSKQKYGFKSYKIPKIYETLQRGLMMRGGGGGGEATSAVHMELHEALNEYYSKEQYYKDFMAACEPIAANEANKPIALRASFPTVMETQVATGVASLVVAPSNPANNNAATAGSEASEAPEINDNNEDVIDIENEEKEEATSTTVSFAAQLSTPSKRAKKAGRRVTPSSGGAIRRGTKRHYPDSSDDDDDDDDDDNNDRLAVDPPARNTHLRRREKRNEGDGTSNTKKSASPKKAKTTTLDSSSDDDDDVPIAATRARNKKIIESDDSESEAATATKPKTRAKMTTRKTTAKDDSVLPPAKSHRPDSSEKEDVDEDMNELYPPFRNTRRRQKEKRSEGDDGKKCASLKDGASNDTMDESKEGLPAKVEQKQAPSSIQKSTATMEDQDQENLASKVAANATRADESSEQLPSVVGTATPAEISRKEENQADNSDEGRHAAVVKEEPKEEEPGDAKEKVEEVSTDPANNNDKKKQEIESRRTELVKMLARRKSDGKDDSDPLCKKIEQKIDAEDEKLLELILLE